MPMQNIVAYNDGYACKSAFRHRKKPMLHKYAPFEDFIAGEALNFDIYPPSRFVDGAQWHILSALSGDDTEWNCGWGGIEVKYSVDEFAEYLKEVWKKNGVVTVDMALSKSGKFYDGQKEFIKNVMGKVK